MLCCTRYVSFHGVCLSGNVLMSANSILALTLGRPMSVPNQCDVSLPSNLDDDYITEAGYIEQPNDVKCMISFFIASISYCSIVKDVLNTLYTTSQRKITKISQSPQFNKALILDTTLVEWYQELPEYLKIEATDDPEQFQWIRNILLSR